MLAINQKHQQKWKRDPFRISAYLDTLSPHSWHNLLLAGYQPPGRRWPPLPTRRHLHTASPYDSCISWTTV